MSSDVQQWLAEIRSLQQQLQTVQAEREAADASACKWRDLYQAEAQQRRTEAELMRDRITELEDALAQATAPPAPLESLAADQPFAPAERQPPDDLHQQFSAAQAEVIRLQAALKAERASHEQTRQNLMTALADTMDLFTREKSDRSVGSSAANSPPAESNRDRPNTSAARNPSPELPPFG